MFKNEAGFGKINKPKYYCTKKIFNHYPSHHIREYRYAYEGDYIISAYNGAT